MKRFSKLGEHRPRRIVILRALQLGDLLCFVPALRSLRSALPESGITLIGLPWARSFVDRFNDYLDDFIEFPGFPGLPEREPQLHRLPDFFRAVQEVKFDLALQMHGSGEVTNTVAEMFGARSLAGFYTPGQYCPDPNRFLPYPDGEQEVWRHLRLMEFLGIPLQGDELEFPLSAQDWEDCRQLQAAAGLQSRRYACLHPGARSQDRRWPVERFAAVAQGLAARGLQVVLTGTEEEAPLTRAVASQAPVPTVDLAGKTHLGSLAALLADARVLVSNDTGVSHLTAALCTPSVILFMASDPDRWAPKNRKMHRVILQAGISGPEVVLAEVDDLLFAEPAYAA